MDEARAAVGAPSASSPWVTEKRARRVREILRAAARLFAEKGYDQTNFDDIAAQLGMRGVSLYHYVASKDELFISCVEVTTQDVVERLDRVAVEASTTDPVGRLRALFREQVLVETRDYPEFAAVFYRIQHPDPEIRRRVKELRKRHAAVFLAAAQDVADAGDLPADRWKVSFMLAVGALSTVQDWFHTDGRMSLEQMADEVADDLVHLLRAGRPDPA